MQIITEAAYRLREFGEKMVPGIDWEGFCGTRNLLRHTYDRIDDAIILNTIKDDLPLIREFVTKMLSAIYPETRVQRSRRIAPQARPRMSMQDELEFAINQLLSQPRTDLEEDRIRNYNE